MIKGKIKRALTVIFSATIVLALTSCTKSTTEAAGSSAPLASSPTAEADAVSDMPVYSKEPVLADGVTFRDESGNVILNSTHIKNVKADKSDGENYAVLFTFTDEGGNILTSATSEMIGQMMSLYIDENQVFSAEIMFSITNGELMLGGTYTKEEADTLVKDLKAGLKSQGQSTPTSEPAQSIPPQSSSVNTADVDALLGKLQNLDFSDISGTYYSEKFGYAEIREDGIIIFDTYYIGANTTPRSNVILSSIGSRGEELEVNMPEDESYIFWHIMNSNYYNRQLNAEIMIEEWITIFPIGVPTVGNLWMYGPVINCPDIDTSEYRFVMPFLDTEIMDSEVFIRQSQVVGEGAPDVDILLNGFEVFRDIGFTSQQQEIIRTTLREFFLKNYPGIKSLTVGREDIVYDENDATITYFYFHSDTGETFNAKLEVGDSMFEVAVSIFDDTGKMLKPSY